VLLLPGRALKEQVNYFAPPRSMGEADLDGHLSNPASKEVAAARKEKKRRVEKAALELRYLLDEKEDEVAKALRRDGSPSPHGDLELTPEQQEDEEADADPDRFVEDYQIRFARELLKRSPHADRARLLEGAKALVAERQAEEESRLAARFKELGVDWSDGAAAAGTPRAEVTVSPAQGKDFRAGETAQWTVTVQNSGDAPFRRLRAHTSVEKNPLLDRREFVFGTVRPGEKRSWTIPVKIPKGMSTRRDEVTLHFEDDAGKAPPEVTTTFGIVEIAKPMFAFSLQVDDRASGNGDGLAQRGETFTLRVDVRNAGAGTSGDKTYVSLKNLGDEKLFIKKGREVVGALKPGEVKSASMEVEFRRGSKSDTLPIRVMVVDEAMDEYVAEKLEWPVAKEEPLVAPAKSSVQVAVDQAVLRSGASASAAPIASAKRGVVLASDARVGEFWRVEWQKGRFAFAADGDVKQARGARARAGQVVAATWQREPPRITLLPDPMRGAPVVEGDRLRLEGTASVPLSLEPGAGRLRDVFVYVNDQKVFFKVVPESAAASKLDFVTDLPLEPGNNFVTVFAREDDEFQSRRSMVIYRKPPAEVAQDAASSQRQPQ
jgi:carboxyl-terminal processing protease